jgi:hypothetical protein
MCENVAVTWSQYDTVRDQIENDVRHKIYDELKEVIEYSKLHKLSDQFIAGLECAQSKVIGFKVEEIEQSDQSVLFDI